MSGSTDAQLQGASVHHVHICDTGWHHTAARSAVDPRRVACASNCCVQSVQKGGERDVIRSRITTDYRSDSAQGSVVLIEERSEFVPMATHIRQRLGYPQSACLRRARHAEPRPLSFLTHQAAILAPDVKVHARVRQTASGRATKASRPLKGRFSRSALPDRSAGGRRTNCHAAVTPRHLKQVRLSAQRLRLRSRWASSASQPAPLTTSCTVSGGTPKGSGLGAHVCRARIRSAAGTAGRRRLGRSRSYARGGKYAIAGTVTQCEVVTCRQFGDVVHRMVVGEIVVGRTPTNPSHPAIPKNDWNYPKSTCSSTEQIAFLTDGCAYQRPTEGTSLTLVTRIPPPLRPGGPVGVLREGLRVTQEEDAPHGHCRLGRYARQQSDSRPRRGREDGSPGTYGPDVRNSRRPLCVALERTASHSWSSQYRVRRRHRDRELPFLRTR